MMRIGLTGILLGIAMPAYADSDAWAEMTRVDLTAARDMLANDHPAGAPGLLDTEFDAAIARYDELAERAREVRTFGGYRAILKRFAAGFGDLHIGFHPTVQESPRWPGFLVSSRAGEWRVVGETEVIELGARLLSCDDREPDAMAEARLAPITPGWDLKGQRFRASARLFVDERDPFVQNPESCLFRLADGSERTVELNWTSIAPDQLQQRLAAVEGYAERAYMFEPFEDGHWLRLGLFTREAEETVNEFVAARGTWQDDPYLVIDVRNNGGGSAAYAHELARAIYGNAAVEEALQTINPGDGRVLRRVSEGNLEFIDYFARQYADNPEIGGYYSQLAEAMRAADTRDEAFAVQPTSLAAEEAERSDIAGYPGIVYILTDTRCFSACLEFAQLFRELGAVQIGDETDGGLNYSDSRADRLPSDLARFSVVQAYTPSRPLRLGPFPAEHSFEGDLSDDTAVREWVRTIVASGS